MTVGPPSTCLACERYDREANTCAAFPDGVPDNITMRGYDHRQPYPGDRGIRFQLQPGRERMLEAYDEYVADTVEKAFNPQEARDAHGEWTADGSGGVPPITQPLIPPHLSATRTLAPLKGQTESREVANTENWNATRFGSLDPAYQKKILAKVKAGSPNKLTPEMMRKNLDAVMQHAANFHWEIPAGGKDADGHWAAGPDDIAAAGEHWYNDANKAAWDLTVKGGIDIDHAVGIIASLSPQTDWDSNIAMANFVGEKLKADDVVTLPPDEVEYRHRQSMSSKGDAHGITIPVGKKLSEMSSGEAAWALYAMASVEELKNGLTTLGGKPKRAQLSMGAQNVAKAVDIFRGAEPGQVLSGHKVRSFYNNIMDPDDTQGKGDVTVDTHMVSAATGYRVTASGKTIKKMFEAGANTKENVKGAYALFADAVRSIAHAYGMSPNKVQAIIWTHWQTVKGGHHGYREDFPEIAGDVPPKTDRVKKKEAESKARAAARAKAKKGGAGDGTAGAGGD